MANARKHLVAVSDRAQKSADLVKMLTGWNKGRLTDSLLINFGNAWLARFTPEERTLWEEDKLSPEKATEIFHRWLEKTRSEQSSAARPTTQLIDSVITDGQQLSGASSSAFQGPVKYGAAPNNLVKLDNDVDD
jgi:hypothetical protein